MQSVNHKLTAPVVRQVKRVVPLVAASPRFTSAVRGTRSLTGDNDMWGLVGKMLLTMLIVILVGALVAVIAEAVLTTVFSAETVELILSVTWWALVSLMCWYGSLSRL
jgi:hypothetical protein